MVASVAEAEAGVDAVAKVAAAAAAEPWNVVGKNSSGW